MEKYQNRNNEDSPGFNDASLNQLVQNAIQRIGELKTQHEEQLLSYPINIEVYAALGLNQRMTEAFNILYHEKKGDGIWTDISHLSDSAVTLRAHIVHSEGKWTNALNDTYVSKLPHLHLRIKTTQHGHDTTATLGDLEKVSHFNPGTGYNSYIFSHNTFQALDTQQWKAKPIEDTEHPLFRDMVAIVDTGIAEIYNNYLQDSIDALNI